MIFQCYVYKYISCCWSQIRQYPWVNWITTDSGHVQRTGCPFCFGFLLDLWRQAVQVTLPPAIPGRSGFWSHQSGERLVEGAELDIAADKTNSQSDFVKDLSADSIDTTNIISGVDAEFNVKIKMEEAETIETVQDLIDYIVKAL